MAIRVLWQAHITQDSPMCGLSWHVFQKGEEPTWEDMSGSIKEVSRTPMLTGTPGQIHAKAQELIGSNPNGVVQFRVFIDNVPMDMSDSDSYLREFYVIHRGARKVDRTWDVDLYRSFDTADEAQAFAETKETVLQIA